MALICQGVPAAVKCFRSSGFECLTKTSCLTISKRSQSTAGGNDTFSSIKPVALSYLSFENTNVETTLKPLLINHGLMGSKTNWKSLAKRFNQKTGSKVYSLDARNHGESPWTDEMSIPHMAADIEYFMKQMNHPKCAILGHSLGGRSCMYFALTKPHLVDRMIIVDMTPNHNLGHLIAKGKVSVLAMKEALAQLTPEMTIYEARQKADAFMELTIKSLAHRQFLLMNLQKGEKNFEYSLNLKALENNLETLLCTPLVNKVYEGHVLLIRAGNSAYVPQSDFPLIKKLFPRVQIETIENASHWVHADKPNEVIELVCDFLLKK